ncbi:MAG: hypothetical protein LBI77_02385 [Puniceicoccales bacterium]|jgi:hypothetical protein|nr:hypothetical protein [Puniceicoccales bacterium]
MHYLWNLIFFSIFLIISNGCREKINGETEDVSYRNGQQLLQENFPERALSQFLKVIETVPDAQKSYLEAGQIFLNTYDDPIFAIYYFRQFLLHNRQRQNEKVVNELIETAKKRFLQQMIGKNRELYSEHQNFLSLLKHLRDENTQLRTEVESYKNRR